MDELDHYYGVLGVKPPLSREELKQAYRDLAQVWHPDRFLGSPRLQEKATSRLREINQAYRILIALVEQGGASAESQKASTPPTESSRNSAAPPTTPHFRFRFSRGEFAPTKWHLRLGFLVVIAIVLAVVALSRYVYGMLSVPVANADFILRDASRITGSRLPESIAPMWPPIPRVLDVQVGRRDSPPVAPRPAVGDSGAAPNSPASSNRKKRAAQQSLVSMSNSMELIPSRIRQGVGTLRMINRTLVDVVAVFATVQHPKIPVRMVYVVATNEVLLSDIGPGSYLLTFQSGSKWLPTELRFAEGRFSSGPFGPFSFWAIEGSQGSQSDHYQIILRVE